jgi:tyrosinase
MADFVPNPITVTLQAPTAPFRRADIALHGVDHSKSSYEGRLFFNNPDATPSTPADDEHYYAGSFWVFGHGGCAGDEGHCEVPATRRPFDFRPEHQLTAQSYQVVVTSKLRQMTEPGRPFTLTIVPYVRPEVAEPLPGNLLSDLLHVERIDLLTYK